MSRAAARSGWRKASRTIATGDKCVELHHGDQLVRDSKNDGGPTLRLSVPGLVAFARAWSGEQGPGSA